MDEINGTLQTVIDEQETMRVELLVAVEGLNGKLTGEFDSLEMNMEVGFGK